MATIPNVLSDESFWMDRRLLTVYHNEFAYEAEPPATMEEWKERRDFTRAQVLLAAGLDPMPEKTPLAPKIWGHFKKEGVIVAKVEFESLPGLKCTGNLYLPELVKNPAPGILSPHGHWQTGRVHDAERGSVVRRAMMLARLGFVVFSYDMVGYLDNDEILHAWPEELRRQYALSGVSPFGLHTWNSLRAVDFLCSLPEVDANRIGCTGASGGASQTWYVSVLDERIKVIVPTCMLSSHFQGGCQCEKGPLLRINGLTSFDVLCACAPRPLMLPSCTRDWTNLISRYEVPALRKVYALFGAEDALATFCQEAEHNYNQETRERVYSWFTHWLLNQSLRERIVEDSMEVPTPQELLIHPERYNPDVDFAKFQTKDLTPVRKKLDQVASHLCAGALPKASEVADLRSFQAQRAELVGELVNNDQELKDVAVRLTFSRWALANGNAQNVAISRRGIGDIIPATRVRPKQASAEAPAVLLLSSTGKADFFVGGSHANLLDTLLERHCNVLAADLMGSGETAEMPAKSPRNEHHPLFYTFNPTLFSMRVQDILTCLQLMQEDGYRNISLVATGDAVKPALCALALVPRLHAAVLDMENQEDNPAAWQTELAFQPGIFKVGGMKGLATLANVETLALYKASEDFQDYVTEFSKQGGRTTTIALGRESLQRLVDQYAAK
ncbi:MAG: acetylxylan esterase [Victivallales bacterium]|nr:acetylxylan esterase [Victivallales bacterium]